MEDVCSNCGLTFKEILENGAVGCERCYQLKDMQISVDNLFNGNIHKGRCGR